MNDAVNSHAPAPETNAEPVAWLRHGEKIEECRGLAKPLSDDRVATKVRSIVNIRSRADLNDDFAAAARWQELRTHFDAWRRRG
ncbi:hypothetical protein [Ensifer aridi]|uniref:hypothetical protein n=1 Tax=Ensifer aridi TaxID=1708715 RepID=UPI000A0FA750|nr:hypothetical protein [Ensifer aridi]